MQGTANFAVPYCVKIEAIKVNKKSYFADKQYVVDEYISVEDSPPLL